VDQILPIRKDLIRTMVSLLSQGIQENLLDDSEKLLAAVSILSPDLDCIDEFKAYIAIKRGRVSEALQSYLAAPAESSKWFVMTALCLKLSSDPTWHWHATQCLEKEDAFSQYSHSLARVLLGIEPSVKDDTNTGLSSAADFPSSYTNYLAV